MNWPDHGGQPQYIKPMFQIPQEQELLDFSANLNPIGSPEWLAGEWSRAFVELDRYPDPHYSSARAAIADHEGLRMEQALLTNGGAETIFLVAKHFESKRALIVQPAFLEYERACGHYHIETEHVFLDELHDFALPLDEIISRLKSVDLIFLCRPNNPTGTVPDEKQMKVLLEESLRERVTVVVDEAFADFLPDHIASLTGWLERYPNLILLRSLTKMYTVPGLRIGYMLAAEELISAMQGYQIPWSVNAAASHLVPRLLKEQSHVLQTKTWLQQEQFFIKEALEELMFYQSPTKVNFYLLSDLRRPDDTPELFRFLLEHGILARHTQTFKGLNGRYLRFAVRSHAENRQLLSCLRQWRERHL